MKKRIITAAAFTACLALCATAWPQNEPVKETPTVPTPTAVTATKPKVPEEPEIIRFTIPEKEEDATKEPKQTKAVTPAPEPPQTLTPSVSEVQAFPEQDVTPLQESEPAPAPPDSALDNMVYVPGFGWLESQRRYVRERQQNRDHGLNSTGQYGSESILPGFLFLVKSIRGRFIQHTIDLRQRTNIFGKLCSSSVSSSDSMIGLRISRWTVFQS